MANVIFRIETDSAGAISNIKAYGQALQGLGPTATTAGNQATTAFDRISSTLSKAKSAVVGFVAAVAFATVIRAFRDVVNAGIEFEDSFAGIRKTVDGAAHEFVTLSEQMRQLAKDIPIGVDQLNKIGEIAGALGIAAPKIAAFTETIAKIGLATNLSVEEAADGFARFANIMEMPIEGIKTFASVVVDLGNKFPATEQEILSFSLNIAGAGKQVGLSADQIAALATALASTGLHAEKAGSAVSRILKTMAMDVEEGGAALEKWAKIAEQSTEDFAAGFEKDASSALLKFLEGLKKVSDSGTGAFTTLEKFGLSEIRVSDVTLRLSGAVAVLDKALRDAKAASAGMGDALENEVEKRLATARVELDKVWARLHDVAISFSNDLTPSVVASAKALATLAEWLRENSFLLTGLIAGITGLGFAWTGLKIITWVASIKAVSGAMASLQIALMLGKGGFAALAAEAKAFWLAMAPVAPLIIALAALGGAIAYAANEHKKYKDAVQAAADAEDKMVRTMMASKKALEEKGIVVHGFSIQAIKDAQTELTTREWFEGRVAEMNLKRIAAIESASEAEQKAADEFQKAITKMMESVTGSARETQILEIALKRLLDAGVPLDLIFDALGDSIGKTDATLNAMNQTVPKTIAMLAALQKASAGSFSVKGGAGILDTTGANNLWGVPTQTASSTTTSLDSLAAQIESAVEAAGLIKLSQGKYAMEVAVKYAVALSEFEEVRKAAEKIRENMDKELEKTQKFFLNVFDNLFEKMVRNGTLAWKDIAKAAADFFQPLSSAFFKPLSDKMGSWAESFSTTLKTKLSDMLGGAGGKGIGDLLGAVVSAGIGMAIGWAMNKIGELFGKIGEGRRTATEFTSSIQNPFGSALAELVDGANALTAAGKMTLKGAIDARDAVKELWKNFQSDAAEFAAQGNIQAKVVRQAFETLNPIMAKILNDMEQRIVELGGTAGMTVEDLDDVNDALKELADFANDVASIVSRVTGSADGLDAMVAALATLQEMGIPTARIVEVLGDDISKLATALRTLGLEVPDVISELEALAIATNRLEEVNKEIKDISEQLGKTLTSKLNLLNKSVADSEKNIDSWEKTIENLTDSIGDARDKLRDAEYWQKRYTDGIKDAENALKSATDKRKSMEDEIEKLTVDVERDRLRRIIANSTVTITIAKAEAALKQLEAAEDLKEMNARKSRLEELRRELPGAIEAETEAITQLELRKVAVESLIAAEKAQLQATILSKTLERNQLQSMIAVEQLHIATLRQKIADTKALMDIMGVSHLTELEQLDSTIAALIKRGMQLENEKKALEDLVGVTTDAAFAFRDLADAIEDAAAANPETVELPPPLMIPPELPEVDPNVPTDPFWAEIWRLRQQNSVPSFIRGTPDTGPKPLLAILDPHERVLTAAENRMFSSGQMGGAASLVIHNAPVINIGGDVSDPDDMQRRVQHALEDSLKTVLDGQLSDNRNGITDTIKKHLKR